MKPQIESGEKWTGVVTVQGRSQDISIIFSPAKMQKNPTIIDHHDVVMAENIFLLLHKQLT